MDPRRGRGVRLWFPVAMDIAQPHAQHHGQTRKTNHSAHAKRVIAETIPLPPCRRAGNVRVGRPLRHRGRRIGRHARRLGELLRINPLHRAVGRGLTGLEACHLGTAGGLGLLPRQLGPTRLSQFPINHG